MSAAEAALRESIERHWDESTVLAYGELETDEPFEALERAESWLPAHPEDAALLLTCAQLAARAELYGKARSYLETSIAIRPRLEAYQLLASLMEQLGERERAVKALNDALAFAVGRKAKLPKIRHASLAGSPAEVTGEGLMPYFAHHAAAVAASAVRRGRGNDPRCGVARGLESAAQLQGRSLLVVPRTHSRRQLVYPRGRPLGLLADRRARGLCAAVPGARGQRRPDDRSPRDPSAAAGSAGQEPAVPHRAHAPARARCDGRVPAPAGARRVSLRRRPIPGHHAAAEPAPQFLDRELPRTRAS